MNILHVGGASALLGFFLAAPALAVSVPVVSYAMPNGNGQASGGSFNYWDLAYNGAGSTNVDGAALSGGTGDLTDGVVAGDFWYNVENGAGTGPYVGWYSVATLNPVLTFSFSGSPLITDIAIHIDNSRVGGVFAPAAILVDGVSQAFTAPAIGSIGWVSFSGLNLSGNSHSIEFRQDGGWVFVSEIAFESAVPEPASWAMLIAGFGLVGGTFRRRRMLEA